MLNFVWQIVWQIIFMSDVTTAILLFTKRTKKDESFPVKLRITFERKQKYYSIDKYPSQTQEDFILIRSNKSIRGDLKNAQMHYAAVEKKAIDIIREIPEFSFSLFEKKFLKKAAKKGDVFSLYTNYIDKLNSEDRLKTALSYQFSMISLKKYCNSDKLTFAQITPDFLRSYENWMKKNGKSVTTVGFYLRCLRSMFNEAIHEGSIKMDIYPFGNRKYIIPTPRNIKKALTIVETKLIYHYTPPAGGNEERFWSYWIFSFLCNGVNIKDMAKMKYKNIQKDTIVIIRSKTERTSRKNLKPIAATIVPKMTEIIEKFGNKPEKPENYVFPILENGLTAVEEMKKIDNAVHNINSHMTKIAKTLELGKDITTYTARHSFATLMRNLGASKEFIAEMVGHSDPKTTSNYIDSFPDDVKKDWAQKLVNSLDNF